MTSIEAPIQTPNELAVQGIGEWAAILDELAPGWARRVDLDAFRIEDAGCCVLFYAFGHYSRGLERITSYAPDKPIGCPDPSIEDEWISFFSGEEATAYWRAEIARRL